MYSLSQLALFQAGLLAHQIHVDTELAFDIFCMSLFFHSAIANEVILVQVQFILWRWVKTH